MDITQKLNTLIPHLGNRGMVMPKLLVLRAYDDPQRVGDKIDALLSVIQKSGIKVLRAQDSTLTPNSAAIVFWTSKSLDSEELLKSALLHKERGTLISVRLVPWPHSRKLFKNFKHISLRHWDGKDLRDASIVSVCSQVSTILDDYVLLDFIEAESGSIEQRWKFLKKHPQHRESSLRDGTYHEQYIEYQRESLLSDLEKRDEAVKRDVDEIEKELDKVRKRCLREFDVWEHSPVADKSDEPLVILTRSVATDKLLSPTLIAFKEADLAARETKKYKNALNRQRPVWLATIFSVSLFAVLGVYSYVNTAQSEERSTGIEIGRDFAKKSIHEELSSRESKEQFEFMQSLKGCWQSGNQDATGVTCELVKFSQPTMTSIYYSCVGDGISLSEYGVTLHSTMAIELRNNVAIFKNPSLTTEEDQKIWVLQPHTTTNGYGAEYSYVDNGEEGSKCG